MYVFIRFNVYNVKEDSFILLQLCHRNTHSSVVYQLQNSYEIGRVYKYQRHEWRYFCISCDRVYPVTCLLDGGQQQLLVPATVAARSACTVASSTRGHITAGTGHMVHITAGTGHMVHMTAGTGYMVHITAGTGHIVHSKYT